jgi:menaquinone-dependent protoporphyrinogen oxidase
MRVLVTWGSDLGGTEGIGRMLADGLREEGVEVEARPAQAGGSLDGFDAVIVGGALYANRWHKAARRFVDRHVTALRRVPVWFFSSGPLDDSADKGLIAPVSQVEVLMERVGARGHITFGGRLERDAKGFMASSMAKTTSGDWRNPARIRSWARELAEVLPSARPRPAVDHPARALPRLFAHGVAGWVLCTLVMLGLLQIASTGVSFALHAIVTPVIFSVIAWHYFRRHGARDPLPTAITFTVLNALLDLVVVAGLIQGDLAMFRSFFATWLPFLTIFGVTWATGGIMSTMPWPKPVREPAAAPAAMPDQAAAPTR